MHQAPVAGKRPQIHFAVRVHSSFRHQANCRCLIVSLFGAIVAGVRHRLSQIAMAGLAAIAIGGAATSASAEQFGTFENRLAGATIGLPLGAAPATWHLYGP